MKIFISLKLFLDVTLLLTSCIQPDPASYTKEIEEEILERYNVLFEALNESVPHIKNLLYCFTTEGIPTKPSDDPQKKSEACTTTNDPTRLFHPPPKIIKIINDDFVDSTLLYVPVIESKNENAMLSKRDDFLLSLELKELKKKISHKMLFRTTKKVKERLAPPLEILQRCFLNIQSPTDISNEIYHPVFLQKKFRNYMNLFDRYTTAYTKSKIALELLQKLFIAFDDDGIPQKFTIETSGRILQGNIEYFSDKSVLFMDERNSQWSTEFLYTISVKGRSVISEGLQAKSLPYVVYPPPVNSKPILQNATIGTWKNAHNSLTTQQAGIYFLRITQQINKSLTYPVQLLQEVLTSKL